MNRAFFKWPVRSNYRKKNIGRTSSQLYACLFVLIVALSSGGTVFAQSSGGQFTLRKFVVANGGAVLNGAPFKATVTHGQAIAIVQTGGSFRLTSGFHAPKGSTSAADRVFCDGFEGTACAP